MDNKNVKIDNETNVVETEVVVEEVTTEDTVVTEVAVEAVEVEAVEVEAVKAEAVEEVVVETVEETVEETVTEVVAKETVTEAEETMDDYKDMLDSSMRQFRSGEIVEGEVISVTETEVLINFGYIADGIVPVNQTLADAEHPLTSQFAVGDKVKAEVVKKDDGDGNVLLSLKKALQLVAWDNLEAAMEAGTIVDAVVTEAVKGGLVCKVLQARAFMPGSMITTTFVEDFTKFNGQTLKVKVMELDREKNRVIVSHKVIEVAENAVKRDALFDTIKKGDVFTGTVKKNMAFGSFVDIGGVDGLVHISELSWKKVASPSDVVKEGEKVTVTVINVDKNKKKIGLSMKDAKDDPWNETNESLQIGKTYEECSVKRVLDFGAFVEVIPGIEGLVHISQICKERINHPSEKVKEGDKVSVKVLGIDAKEKKLKLTMKLDAEVDGAQENFNVNIKDYQTDEQATTSLSGLFGDIKLNVDK